MYVCKFTLQCCADVMFTAIRNGTHCGVYVGLYKGVSRQTLTRVSNTMRCQ